MKTFPPILDHKPADQIQKPLPKAINTCVSLLRWKKIITKNIIKTVFVKFYFASVSTLPVDTARDMTLDFDDETKTKKRPPLTPRYHGDAAGYFRNVPEVRSIYCSMSKRKITTTLRFIATSPYTEIIINTKEFSNCWYNYVNNLFNKKSRNSS